MLMLYILFCYIYSIYCQIKLDHKSKGDLIKKVKMNRKIPALEYLGCGYDILYGNPLLDPETLVDPGYREPIISYSIVNKQRGHVKRMIFSKINGAWIRPLIECKRSNQKSIVNNMSEYVKVIGIDGDVSLSAIDDTAKFSLSANYNQTSEALNFNKNRLYIERSYCFLLEAGLPIHSDWRFRKSFIVAARKLKPDIKEFVEKCSLIKFTINPHHMDCKYGIKPWIDMFKQFGTHVSYNIKIGLSTFISFGGKKTDVTVESTKKKKNNDEKELNANLGATAYKSGSGINGEVALGLGYKENKQNNSNDMYKYTNILGGISVGDMESEENYVKWIKSIYKYPMPIRSQFAPLSMLFKNVKLKNAYNNALKRKVGRWLNCK